MKNLLHSNCLTLPSNYHVKGIAVEFPSSPGYSCTPEEWEKALRMESTYYDWKSYERCQMPKAEHPEYRRMSEDASLVEAWEAILKAKVANDEVIEE